jgi:NAD-dependent SIR2 family protein deacetylase
MPTINVEPSSDQELQEIADVLAKSRKVVVITGAGISTNCGIPVSERKGGTHTLTDVD